MNKKHIIVGVFVFLVILVIGGVWCWQEKIVKEEKNGDGLVDAVPSTVENDNDANQNNQVEYDFSQDLDVSKWAVYESAKVGMRIKYPKDWEVVNFDDPKSDVGLRPPGVNTYMGSIYVGSISNLNELSIKDLFDTFDDTSRFWFTENAYEELPLPKRNGIYFPEIVDKVQYSNQHTEAYFVTGENIVYSFQYIYLEDQKNPLISQILKEVVENFEPLQ